MNMRDRKEHHLMTARFTGKVALVTGGGTGIGRSIARAFAREGARVVVAGRRAEPLDETVELIVGEGGEAIAVAADVTQSADVAELISRTVGHFGSLDIAVNNVGVLRPGAVGDLDEDDWRASVETNITGTWLSMKHEIAHMRSNGGGSIVNVASNLGSHARLPGLGAYVASKAAVSALTQNAALDHVADGIRINAVSPGPVDTSLTLMPGETEEERDARFGAQVPLGRIGRTDDVASAVLYLASDDAGFIVGTDLRIDGGAAA
jgi:NAD(P)-dependent dehydrogenase (short-subunit alcohol dehydrogenase family)